MDFFFFTAPDFDSCFFGGGRYEARPLAADDEDPTWAGVPGVDGLNPRVAPGFRGNHTPPWNPIRGNHGARYPLPP